MFEKFLMLAVNWLSAIAFFAEVLSGETVDNIFLAEKF